MALSSGHLRNWMASTDPYKSVTLDVATLKATPHISGGPKSQFTQAKTVQTRVLPPFTEKLCPVMKPAPSLARKATSLATSSGLPIRFMGTPDM